MGVHYIELPMIRRSGYSRSTGHTRTWNSREVGDVTSNIGPIAFIEFGVCNQMTKE